MQLVVVSGLSGSGKSIALKVLEDDGYYCVDNLPATLLDDVTAFLAEAGHDRVAVSVDARSAALAALPERIAHLRSIGIDCRLLFLDASSQTLLRRFSETRRRHPLLGPARTLAEAIEHERALLAGVAELGERVDTSEVEPQALRRWVKALLALSGGVDSAVALVALRELGCEVQAVTFKNFCYGETADPGGRGQHPGRRNPERAA